MLRHQTPRPRPAPPAALRPAAAPAGRWLTAVSVHRVSMLLVPLAAITVAIVQPVDFDYWWHRRTGEEIVRSLSVPRSDPYSFTAAGHAWVDHEWLAQVLMYLVQGAFGYLGLFLALMALGVAALWLVYRLLRDHGLGEMQALALCVAPAAFGGMYWRARPAMFTVFFTALFVSELWRARGITRADAQDGPRRGDVQGDAAPPATGSPSRVSQLMAMRFGTLWHLPVLLVLWANLHGGYVVGLALIALFAVAQGWDAYAWSRAAPSRDVAPAPPGASWQRATVVLLVAFLATAINPYTWRLWLYPVSYLIGDNASLRLLDEWKSPDFHELRNLPLAALLLIALVAGANGRRFDAWRTLLMLMFGAMALQAMRHQPLFALVWAPLVGASLVERWPVWAGERARPAPTRAAAGMNLGLLAGGIAALLTVVVSAPQGIPLRDAPAGGAYAYPVASADYIEEHAAGAQVFNEYAWGGYLIDRLYPDTRVFIDGRADVYEDLVPRQVAATRGDGWERLFDEYDVDLVLLAPATPLLRELRHAGWRPLVEDDSEVLLAAPYFEGEP